MERVFELSGLLVMPFWLAMILLPRLKLTRRVMTSLLPPLLPALVYAALVAPRLAELLPLLARPEVGPIAALLGSVEGATIAWLHFLSFDLFVGRWIYLDSRERGLTAWWVSPVLLLTLLFGPAGLLSYLAVRAVAERALPRRESVPGGVL